MDATEDLDLVTQDMLIGQSCQLEEFHWSVRAHLETPDGSLTTGNASIEKTAAKRAKKRWPRPGLSPATTTMSHCGGQDHYFSPIVVVTLPGQVQGMRLR